MPHCQSQNPFHYKCRTIWQLLVNNSSCVLFTVSSLATDGAFTFRAGEAPVKAHQLLRAADIQWAMHKDPFFFLSFLGDGWRFFFFFSFNGVSAHASGIPLKVKSRFWQMKWCCDTHTPQLKSEHGSVQMLQKKSHPGSKGGGSINNGGGDPDMDQPHDTESASVNLIYTWFINIGVYLFI